MNAFKKRYNIARCFAGLNQNFRLSPSTSNLLIKGYEVVFPVGEPVNLVTYAEQRPRDGDRIFSTYKKGYNPCYVWFRQQIL